MTDIQQYCYDIFLSFRGEDTRHTFTGYLYNALCERGFKAFIDDEELKRGEEISPALIKAIEESKASIVIFSENYAFSPWCLNELVKILECKTKKGQIVWPIFYKVDPSDVRHQRNSYKEAMVKHENVFKSEMEKVNRWRSALNEAANMSGWTFGKGYEYKLITDIIEETSSKLHPNCLYIGEQIIGLKYRLEELKSLLDIQYDDTVRMLGIHGIGGIGKTTLAKVLYNSIGVHFDCACFLESIRERSNDGMDLVNVQEKLLSQIFRKKNFNLGNVDEGAYLIKNRLCNRRVLLVLDDVDKMEQLEKLAGGCDWFGPGSKIIITTRNKHMLSAHGIEKTYEMKELDHNKALELFCWKAFKRNKPNESYMDISNRIIDYAKGLPLALKVIGSNLFGRSLKAWESALDKYQRTPDKGIQDILRVSYDDLDDDQKTIFLDIACFFKGKRLEYVEKILDACDLSPQYNIEVLVDKSLLTIEVGKLRMHNLLQDMGKEVVRQEASSKHGEYSRLWNHEAILNVLTTNSGSDRIQGVIFHPRVPEKVEWSGTTFEKMSNLRILIVRNVKFSIGPKSLPNTLRLLEWEKFPSEALPLGFCPRKMVVLKLSNCRLISLNPLQKHEKLICMDLSHSQLLTQVPDVSGAPNISTLKLEGCINLKVIHDSVGRLTKLLDLSLEGCTNLEVFPHGIYMTSLRSLNFNDCVSLQHFPEILGQMDNLNRIDAERTGIKQIPHSICYLPKLESLFLRFNDNLESIPESINQLDALRNLNLHDCKKLQHISGFPPRLQDICVVGCISLTSQSLNTVWSQVLQEIEFLNVSMPRTRIPNWFDYCCKSGKLSFWARRKYPKFAFAVACGKSTNKISSELVHIIVLIYLHGSQDFVTAHYSGGYFNNEGGTFLLELREYITNFNHDDWNLVEIMCTTSSSDYEIEECGVYMYKQDINMEDIQFECSIPNNSNMNAVMLRDDEKIEETKHRTERAVFPDLREFTRGCPMPLNSIMEAVMAMDDENNEEAEPGKSSNTEYVKE